MNGSRYWYLFCPAAAGSLFAFAASAFYFARAALLIGSSSDLRKKRRVGFGVLRYEPAGLVVFGNPNAVARPGR